MSASKTTICTLNKYTTKDYFWYEYEFYLPNEMILTDNFLV